MSYNQLHTLDVWPFTRAQVVYNFVVNLDNNRIQQFSNTLGIPVNCFSNPIQYMTISIRDNLITHFVDLLDAFTFNHFIEIACVFGKPQQFRIDLTWNPTVCDCLGHKLYSMCRIFPHSCFLTENMHCSEPAYLF